MNGVPNGLEESTFARLFEGLLVTSERNKNINVTGSKLNSPILVQA